jgi:hypothetical protein
LLLLAAVVAGVTQGQIMVAAAAVLAVSKPALDFQ